MPVPEGFGSVKAIVNAPGDEPKQAGKVGDRAVGKIREAMDPEYRPRE